MAGPTMHTWSIFSVVSASLFTRCAFPRRAPMVEAAVLSVLIVASIVRKSALAAVRAVCTRSAVPRKRFSSVAVSSCTCKYMGQRREQQAPRTTPRLEEKCQTQENQRNSRKSTSLILDATCTIATLLVSIKISNYINAGRKQALGNCRDECRLIAVVYSKDHSRQLRT